MAHSLSLLLPTLKADEFCWGSASCLNRILPDNSQPAASVQSAAQVLEVNADLFFLCSGLLFTRKCQPAILFNTSLQIPIFPPSFLSLTFQFIDIYMFFFSGWAYWEKPSFALLKSFYIFIKKIVIWLIYFTELSLACTKRNLFSILAFGKL